jgi:hypothetical protein
MKLEIKNLKKVCSETKALSEPGYMPCYYLELFYDTSDKTTWTVLQTNPNWWTEYHDKDIIKVALLAHPKTMQELREMIENAVFEHEQDY